MNVIQWHHLAFIFLILFLLFFRKDIKAFFKRIQKVEIKNIGIDLLPNVEKGKEYINVKQDNILNEDYIKSKLIQEFPYFSNNLKLLNDDILPKCKGHLIAQGIIIKSQFDDLLKEKQYIKILEGLYIDILKRPTDKPFNAESICLYLPALKNHKADFKLINAIQYNLYNSQEYQKLSRDD